MLRNRWAILALLCFARAGMAFQFQAIPPVAELMVLDLGISYAQVGLLIGLFMSPGIFLALPGGFLGAWLGDKRMVLLGLGFLAAGSFLLVGAEGIVMAGAARMLSGVGAVMLNIQLVKITTDWFVGDRLATGMAFLVTTWPVGIALSLATLGTIGQAFSWRVALAVPGFWALAALVLVGFLLKGGAPVKKEERESFRPNRFDVVLSLSAGSVWMIYNAGYILVLSFTPLFLGEMGEGMARAGMLASFVMWMGIITTPLGGVVADRTGRSWVLIVGAGFLTAGLVWLMPFQVAVFALIIAVGIVGGLPAGPIVALPGQVLRPEIRPVGLGIFFTVYYTGMAVLPPVAGWLMDWSGTAAWSLGFAGLLLFLVPVCLGVLSLLIRLGRQSGKLVTEG